ncbi:MAG: hypothetical protein IPO01_13205 [Chitinophagaceae bacterium]|nr:hypothetical protein [Chitinophagaceae bacterium]
MKSILTLFIFIAALLTSTLSHAQNAVDKLNVPGPIMIGKKSHALTWTANPSAGFYKQEYIPAGDNVNKFKSMVMLDLSLGNFILKDIVGAKIAELKKMKATNPLVNYEMFQKNGEYLLDFLLSANAADGKTVDIVERNVYRYKTFTDKSGKKGILLFAVSVRSYGKDIDTFLKALKTGKAALLNEVAQFIIPAVTISK